MGLPFRIPELAQQIARVIHPSAKGSPLDSDDLLEEQQAYDVALQGLIANDEYIDTKLTVVSDALGSTEVATDPTAPLQHNTSRAATILGSFVAQQTGAMELIFSGTVVGTTAGLVVTSEPAQDAVGGGLSASGLSAYRNGAGVIHDTPAAQRLTPDAPVRTLSVPVQEGTEYLLIGFVGVDTVGTDLAVSYTTASVDLTQLHDPAPQDAAIQAATDNLAAEIQNRIDADGTLSARVATVEAQLPDDDSGLAAMIAANAAALAQEMADTDADVVAILANTVANMTATQTNATAASNNAAAIALEASDREAADASLQTGIEGVGTSVSALGTTLNQSLNGEATLRADADAALDARIALVEAQLPDDDTPLANAIAENAAAIAAEILDTDADFVDVLAGIAANATVAQAAQAAAVSNAQDIAGLSSSVANAVLNGIDQSNIGGEKTWSDLHRFIHSTNSFGASVGTNTTEFNGTTHILRFNGPNGSEIRSTANAFIFNGTGTSLSLGATNAVFSNRLRVPATVATDNDDTATSKGYVDGALNVEATAREAADTALDTRVVSLEGLDFQALVSDIAANMAEITDNDGQLITLMAQVSQNAAAQQANATAITTNANALAAETTDRQAADDALQQDIETRDAENVKLSGDQEIDDVKNFVRGDTRFSSPSSAIPGTLRMMFGNALAGLIRYATGDLQITHFRGNTPGARLLLSELFGNFSRRMEFEEDIDARANVNLFDSNGSNRISLRVPSDIAANYNLILPESAPLDDQVLEAQANGTTQWVYPYGHGFQLVEVASHVNTVDNLDDPAALVATIDTAGFAPGLWKFEVEAHFAYNTAATDYIAGLFDEAQTNKNENGGATTSLSYFRKEPKDVAGTDQTGAGGGTNQFEPMNLYAYIQIVEGDDRVISFRHRPDTAGVEAVSRNPKFTTMRVAN